MSKQGLTEIICVLDRSGSMGCIIDDAIGGFNAFLKSQQELDEGEARMTITLFDHEFDIICESKDVKEVEEFTTSTYVPRGRTALNDAIGETIVRMGEIFNKREDSEKPEKVVFVILTDGAENASREYELEKVKDLIERQKTEWSWEFIFLSSDINAFSQGRSYGVSATSRFANTGKATKGVYTAMAQCVSNYRTTGNLGNMDKEIN